MGGQRRYLEDLDHCVGRHLSDYLASPLFEVTSKSVGEYDCTQLCVITKGQRMMKNSRPVDRCGYTVVTVNPSPAQCYDPCSDSLIKLNCTEAEMSSFSGELLYSREKVSDL